MTKFHCTRSERGMVTKASQGCLGNKSFAFSAVKLNHILRRRDWYKLIFASRVLALSGLCWIKNTVNYSVNATGCGCRHCPGFFCSSKFFSRYLKAKWHMAWGEPSVLPLISISKINLFHDAFESLAWVLPRGIWPLGIGQGRQYILKGKCLDLREKFWKALNGWSWEFFKPGNEAKCLLDKNLIWNGQMLLRNWNGAHWMSGPGPLYLLASENSVKDFVELE